MHSSLNVVLSGHNLTSTAEFVSDREVHVPWPDPPSEEGEIEHGFTITVQGQTTIGMPVYAHLGPIDFDPDSEDPNESNVRLGYHMPANGTVRVKVFPLDEGGVSGPPVRTFDEAKSAGQQETIWDGKGDDGEPVEYGVDYVCNVYQLLPGDLERLLVSLDPEVLIPLGGTKRAPGWWYFRKGIAYGKVYVPTGGTLKVKLWGDEAYTMHVYRQNGSTKVDVPQSALLPIEGDPTGRAITVDTGGTGPGNPATPGLYYAHVYKNGGPGTGNFTLGCAFVQRGEASRNPWTGYWWPMYTGSDYHLYDPPGSSFAPYYKYDEYVEHATGTNPGVRAAESVDIHDPTHPATRRAMRAKAGSDIAGGGVSLPFSKMSRARPRQCM